MNKIKEEGSYKGFGLCLCIYGVSNELCLYVCVSEMC